MTKSEQARADALADAETLRLIAWEAPRAHVSNALRKARSLGVRVAGEIEHGGGWLLPHVTAQDAAHAAFRAVPDLRGTVADEKSLHGALCLRSEWLNAPCGCGVGI